MDHTLPNDPAEREPSLADIAAAYTGEIDIDAPEPVHYDPDRLPRLSPCGLDLDEVPDRERATNPAAVTCVLCAATLVDGKLSELGADTQPLPAAEACCDPGPYCDDLPGCVLGDFQPEREADAIIQHSRSQPSSVEDRAALGIIDAEQPQPLPAVDTWVPGPVADLNAALAPVGLELDMASAVYIPPRAVDAGLLPAPKRLSDRAMDAAVDFLGRTVDAEQHEQRATERLAKLVAEEPASAELTAQHSYRDMPVVSTTGCGWCGLPRERHPAGEPERRTVGLEVLTPELRKLFDIWGTRGALVGIVCRVNGEAVDVPEVQTLWEAPYRKPADVLAKMLTQARFYADGGIEGNGNAELLMPTPDVLAALAGQPVGGYTAALNMRYNLLRPGWWVLTERPGDDTWDLVEDRTPCTTPGCVVDTCQVVTVRGRGELHMVGWYPVLARIPADQPAPEGAEASR